MPKPTCQEAKSKSESPKSAAPAPNSLLRLLSDPNGITINELAKATGWQWQPHSIRGFLAGHVNEKAAAVFIIPKNQTRTVIRSNNGEA